ncbi:MAG: 50S ribosomal protein L15 [Ignavibacteria bacterium]|nr:50S ribosomal protein L15 [Bacteroidota bacterium]MSQ46135.1 50S ribosomal protein L15 [Ignavibacteria bacterium]
MTSTLSNLRYAPGSRKKVKRIGRGQGSGHGGTSTRGHNGQWSRSGAGVKRNFEGGQMPIIRRLPKFGFTNIFRTEYSVVNIEKLVEFISKGKLTTTITPATLVTAGLIQSKRLLVKILGDGELKTPLTISAHRFSKSAVEKITSAGGTVTTLEIKTKKAVATN